MPALADRTQYRTAYEPARIAMLRAMIHAAAPRAVVCHGMGYRAAWTELAGAPLMPVSIDARPCFVSETTVSVFVVVPHPTAHGSTSRFWEALVARLRARP